MNNGKRIPFGVKMWSILDIVDCVIYLRVSIDMFQKGNGHVHPGSYS